MTKDIFNNSDKAGIKADIFAEAFDLRCPYLGSRQDQSTILGFPNPANLCYRQEPAAQVSQETQAHFCLTGKHVDCPIFQQVPPAEEPSLPKVPKESLVLIWARKLRPSGRPLDRLRPHGDWRARLRPRGGFLARLRPSGERIARLRPRGDWLARLRPNFEGLEKLRPRKATLQRLRPVLLLIPLLLLLVAALVWWPMPGTTVEDNTSRAAPVQKITTPEEATPELELREGAPAPENAQPASTAPPKAQAKTTPAGKTPEPTPEVEPTRSFRILKYD